MSPKDSQNEFQKIKTVLSNTLKEFEFTPSQNPNEVIAEFQTEPIEGH